MTTQLTIKHGKLLFSVYSNMLYLIDIMVILLICCILIIIIIGGSIDDVKIG